MRSGKHSGQGTLLFDFDHGLNNAVARLREALGDSADTPRFIETLPRKGYRFIAPAHLLESRPDQGATTAGLPQDLKNRPSISAQRRRILVIGGVAVLAITALVAVVVFHRTARPQSTRPNNRSSSLPEHKYHEGVRLPSIWTRR
jgi:hypothetical protein